MGETIVTCSGAWTEGFVSSPSVGCRATRARRVGSALEAGGCCEKPGAEGGVDSKTPSPGVAWVGVEGSGAGRGPLQAISSKRRISSKPQRTHGLTSKISTSSENVPAEGRWTVRRRGTATGGCAPPFRRVGGRLGLVRRAGGSTTAQPRETST